MQTKSEIRKALETAIVLAVTKITKSDPESVRDKAIDAMEEAGLMNARADGFIDELLDKAEASKYTPAIVGGVIVLSMVGGFVAGMNYQ